MVDFLGIHIGKSQKGAPSPPTQDDKMDKLQKQIHSDQKMKERLSEADPYLRAILTPQKYSKNDGKGNTVWFDNVQNRMAAANYLVMRFCAPFLRAGTDKTGSRPLKGWVILYAQFQADCAAKQKELMISYSDDLVELGRKWAEFVRMVETEYLAPVWAIWYKSWRAEDVAPVWTMFLQEAPQFGNAPRQLETGLSTELANMYAANQNKNQRGSSDATT